MKTFLNFSKKIKIILFIFLLLLVTVTFNFFFNKKKEEKIVLPDEKNVTQEESTSVTIETDDLKEKEKKSNERKTTIKETQKEIKNLQKKTIRKKVEEKTFKARSPFDTIIELHTGLKKIYTKTTSLSKIQKLINNTYDTEKMLSLIIGDVWKNLNNKKKSEMIYVFEEYIAKNYIKRFSKIKNPNFTNISEKKVGSHLMVKSILTLNNKEKVSINYLLTQKGQEWKIFDVLLAGSVSEVATKKSEFRSFLKDENVNPLIEALKKKNRELLNKI